MSQAQQSENKSRENVHVENALLGRLQDPVLEVNGQLEPSSAFEHNRGGVAQILSVNEYVMVVRDQSDSIEIYDKKGRSMPLNSEGSQFGVDLNKLYHGIEIDNVRDPYVKLVWRGNSIGAGSYEVKQALTIINEPEELADQVSQYLSRKIPGDEYGQKGMVANMLPVTDFVPYFNGETRASLDPSGNVLSLRTGRCVASFQVKEESGAALPPQEWRRIDVRDVATITGDMLEEKPYLGPYLTSKSGEVLPGGRFRAGFKESILAIYGNDHDVCVFDDKAVSYCLNPNNSNSLLYIRPNSNELVSLDTTSLGLGRNPITVRSLPMEGEFEDFSIDPFGNYLLVTESSPETGGLLHIIDAETLQPACLPIEGVRGAINVSGAGDIYFKDTEDQLRKVSTNLHYLSEGGRDHLRKARLEHLDQLDEAVQTLKLPRLQEEKDAVDPVKLELKEKIQGIQLKLAQRFDRLLERADTPEGIETLKKQINLLENRPDFAQYPELFDVYKDKIYEKTVGFQIGSLKDGLHTLQLALSEEGSFTGSHEEIAEAIQELSRLEDVRRSLRIDSREERREVQQLLADTRNVMGETLTSFRGELDARIDQLLESITLSIQSSESPDELEAVLGEPEWAEFDALCRLSGSPAQSIEWKQKRDELWDSKERQFQLEAERNGQLSERKESEIARELITLKNRIRKSLSRVESHVELGSWRVSNPLYKSFKEQVESLTGEHKEREEQAVERLIKNCELELNKRGTVKLVEKNGVVNFGGRPFPVFADYSVLPTPRVIPTYKGASEGRLVFECHGRRYEVGDGFPLDLQNADTQTAISNELAQARNYFESRTRKVPRFRDSWVINEYVLGNLSEMSRLFKVQQKLGQGILILESEAGVGKNVLIDIFGHFTNREVFTFSCNEDTEKEDLTQAFMFDPSRGTYRASSELLEAIQTPGSVVIFDEINTLRPGASKLLNSLFDYRRSLILPHEDESVEVQDCLFVGAMNLRHYIGTKQMPQEFVSRSRIKKLDYPPEQVNGRYTPYEAEIVSGNIDVLRELSQEEFYKAWDYVVNNDRSNGADAFVSADRERAIRDLHHTVKVANKIREAYNAYQSEESSEEVNFVYSMRENEWIAAEMNEGIDVLEAIKDVVLPKIGDPKERGRVEAIIDNV